MGKIRSDASDVTVVDWIVYGIAFIFITGSLMHFVYEWSGNNPVVGIFAPISESVWEHLKMVFWPAVVWWISGYFILHRKEDFRAARWFTACAAAIVTSLVLIVTLYYTYTCGFGIHSVFLDIFTFFLAIVFGQITGFHFFKYANYSPFSLYVSIAVLILLAAAFVAFTASPPELPIFQVNESIKSMFHGQM